MANSVINNSTIFFLAGMHRSGTSLTAMWLQKCGFELGGNLLSGAWDNKYGHFEDKELLAFAKKVLINRGLNEKGLKIKTYPEITFTQDEKIELTNLINGFTECRNNFLWKEPRTTLWIEELNKLFSELKIIAVYRDYHQVVDSLFRRECNENPFPKRRPNKWLRWVFTYKLKKYKIFNCYLNDWIAYNNSILEFHEKYPDKVLIISLEDIINKPENCIKSLNLNFSLDLNAYPIKKVFDSQIIHKSASLKFDPKLSIKADKIYNEFKARKSA